MKAPAAAPSNKLWRQGSAVTFVDAYGRNPLAAKVLRCYGESNILVEDRRGVVHFGSTLRIVTAPPADVSMFDDLLGDTSAPKCVSPFEDLLG